MSNDFVLPPGPPDAAPDSENRFRALVQNSSDIITVLDAAGTILYKSPSERRVLGYEPEQTLGRSVFTLIHPDDQALVLAAFQGALWRPGEHPPVEFRIRHAGGSWRHLESVLTNLLHDPDVRGVVANSRDVTERRQAEQDLRRSAARYQFLADSMPQIVWTARPDGAVDYNNKQWHEYTGLTFEQTRDWGWQPVLHPDDSQACLNVWSHAVQSGRGYAREFRFRRADGAYRWHLCRAHPLRDAAGRIVQWVGTATDIDDQKRAEEAVQSAAAQQRVFLRDVLASVTEGRLRLCDGASDLPPALPPLGDPVPLSHADTRTLRGLVRDVACARDFADDRLHDLVTATGETAMNAVVHAGGGWGRVCAGPDTVQVWVEDRGAGIALHTLPQATLERGYTTAGTFGHGFWLMLQTVDRVYLLTGPAGTTVVLEQDRTPPDPIWLGGFGAV